MQIPLVVIFTGADRPGIVDRLADVVADFNGNWAESRLACLAGRFAGIIEATFDELRVEAVTAALLALEREGLRVSVERGEHKAPAEPGPLLQLELVGADHPGIVHDVAHVLAARALNIEELTTALASAPMSGMPLFRAALRVRGPADLDLDELRRSLERLADDLMVDLSFAADAQ